MKKTIDYILYIVVSLYLICKIKSRKDFILSYLVIYILLDIIKKSIRINLILSLFITEFLYNNKLFKLENFTEKKLKTITEKRKLNDCEGQCRRDKDCADGLLCFKRAGGKSILAKQKIPGCSIGGIADIAGGRYCYNPKNIKRTYPEWIINDKNIEKKLVSKGRLYRNKKCKGATNSKKPECLVGECEGRCFYDKHCQE